ncbi:MAG: hypothetical protein ABSA32_05445 [Candidatus Acidiferrales bacterium]
MKKILLLAFALLLLPTLARTQAVGTISVTSQVGVTVGVEAALTVLSSPPAVRTEGSDADTIKQQSGARQASGVRQAGDSSQSGDVMQAGGVTMLSSSGGTLSDYTGTTSFTYFIRTGTVGGSGYIKLQVTSDFSPTGGPSVGTPIAAGDTLRYACAISSPGTACSGFQVASVASQTPVGTFTTNAHTAANGSSASILWELTNDPLYQTGTYMATITYTISAS